MAKLISLEEYRKADDWISYIIKDSDILNWRAQHNFKPDNMITPSDWRLCFDSALPDLYDVIDKKDVSEHLENVYPIKVYRTVSDRIVMTQYAPVVGGGDDKWRFLFRAKSGDVAIEHILKNCELTLEDFYEFNRLPNDNLKEFGDVYSSASFRSAHNIPPLTLLTSEKWFVYYTEFINMRHPQEEVRKMPEPDVSAKMNVKSVMDIVGIAADFDWEGVFDIEKRLGYFEDVDCTDLESKNAAIERFRDNVLQEIIDFVLRCEKEDKKDRFLETRHSLRVEYYDGAVMLRYQPIVYDNYE